MNALAYELRSIQNHRDRFGKRRPVHIPPHVWEYVQELGAENMALGERIEPLERMIGLEPNPHCGRFHARAPIARRYSIESDTGASGPER